MSAVVIFLIKQGLAEILEPGIFIEIPYVHSKKTVATSIRLTLLIAFAHYTFSICYGKEWCPSFIGGPVDGSFKRIYQNYPFDEIDNDSEYTFLLIAMGLLIEHLGQLKFKIDEQPKLMTLRHICEPTLIFCCLISN